MAWTSALAIAEMCELSELSELSPERAGPGIDDSLIQKRCAKSAISEIRGLSVLVILIKGLPDLAVDV